MFAFLKSIGSALSIVSGPIKTMVDGWQQRKTAQLQNDLALSQAVNQAKIEKAKTAQEADIAWENTALNKMGIKADIMMVVVLLPLVLCFCGDWGVQIVSKGFTAVRENIPVWWQALIMGTASVSYGIRKWGDFMTFAKGAK